MSKKTVRYFGRDGRQCQTVEWLRLRKDKEYTTVREYDNGQVRVTLEWLGFVEDFGVFKDCWKVFTINVFNYNSVGDIRRDPVDDGKCFPDEAAAIAGYEAFIERWTASHRTADGEFVEEDNRLTPPPPPDPDAPSSDAANIKGIDIGDGDCGAW